MKIGSNYSATQAFRANGDGKRSFMGDVSDVLDTTADFMKVAKNAIDSPEEASVRVLTNSLDNIAKSKKTPDWAAKGIKYLSAGLTAGLTGYAVYRAPGGMKNLLSKFKLGRSALNFAASAKQNIGELFKKLDNNNKIVNGFKNMLVGAKNKAVELFDKAKHFLAGKFPKTAGFVKNYLDKIPTDKLTKTNVAKGAVATALGLSSGKKVVKSYEQTASDKKEVKNDKVEKADSDDIEDMDEAA